jgi:hypothetical protein
VRLPFILLELAGFLWGLYRVEGNRDRMLWLVAILLTYPVFRELTLVDALMIRPGVDRGNPLFTSVFGWSLPVFVTHVSSFVALFGFLLWEREASPWSGR